jgi:hypothetical protein
MIAGDVRSGRDTKGRWNEWESSCAAPNWNMKTKLIIIGLLATANSSHATLIDLTPGGFPIGNAPPIYNELLTQHSQIAGANINGSSVIWSPFEPFGRNEFSITSLGTGALLSWDLSLTDGFKFQYLLLEGIGGIDNIYRVPGVEYVNGTGYAEIDGLTQIQAIIFYGTNVMPETVNTGWLLFFAVVGLLLTYKLRQRRIA